MMTPFRTMVVPPPMSAYSLDFPSEVYSLTFCTTANKMAALLSDGTLFVFTFNSAGISFCSVFNNTAFFI